MLPAMSNAALTNNFPNLFKNFSQKLFQPTGIAVLASLGIHAALGVSLPYLNVSSKEQPKKGTVQLVKLSPTEQSRIPQLSPSSVPNQLSSLYPLPPGLSTSYPPLTSSGLPIGLSPVNPPLNELANNKRSPATTSTSVNSSTPSLKSPKINQTTQSATSKPQQAGKNYAITTGSTRIQGLTNRRDIPSLGLTPAQLPPPAQPPLPPPPLYPPAGGSEPILQARSNPTTTTNPTSPTSTLPSTTNQAPTPLASPSTTPGTTNNPGTTRSLAPRSTTTATAPSTALPALPGSSPQTPAPPKTNGTNNSAGTSNAGTSNDEYQRRTIAALANMGQVEKLEKYATISGAYPQAACVQKLSGTTLITAQVDGQGSVGSTTVTGSSKSPILDDLAEITVSGMNFGAKGKPIAYQVPVEFKYDSAVCGSAAVPKNSTQPQNTATPQNSPTPKKSPEAFNVPTTQDSPAPKKSPEG